MEIFIEAVKQYPCLWNTESTVYRDVKKKEAAWLKIIATLKNKEIPDVTTAKAEWKKLRDSHRDSLKRTKTKTGQDAEVINSWKYAELMQFLLPYMKNMRSGNKCGNLVISETENLTNTNPYSIDLQMVNDANSDSSSQITVQITDNNDTKQHDILSNNTIEPRKRKFDKTDKDFVDLIQEIKESFNRRCEQRDQRRMTESQKATTDKHPLDSFFESMCTTTKQFPTWLQNSVKRKIFTIVSEAEDKFENCNYSSISFTYGCNTSPSTTPQRYTCTAESTLIQDNLCTPPQEAPE